MLAWSIAKRFLVHNKGQTALVLAGIVLGVSVQIFIGSLITGLQTNLVSKTVDNAPQIVIKADTPIGSDLLNKLDKTTSAKISKDALVVSDIGILLNEDNKNSVFFKGMTKAGAQAIYQVDSKLVDGKYPTANNEILIGLDQASKYKLKINDEVEILINQTNKQSFKVVGIFDLGVKTLNESWLFINLSAAQETFGLSQQVTSIEMKVFDVFTADEVAQTIQSTIGDEYIVTDWKTDNAQLLSGLNAQSVSSYMIQFFVIISVTLGIASVLAISVSQKQRQIGILKAMGLNNRQSSLIFLYQGLLLGVIGGLLGVLAGVGMSYAFSTFVKDASGSPISPFFLDYGFLGFSFGIALLACLGSSLIPAITISKLNPIEVIRNG
jgi:lipoprotein-releasing system permease protein